jgi:hypothetical protein
MYWTLYQLQYKDQELPAGQDGSEDVAAPA